MSHRHVSQAEARRRQKRIKTLERILAGGTAYPGGTHLWTTTYKTDGIAHAAFRTARRLGFALVATVDDQGNFSIYAVKP